ncbi:MAG: citrate/2-methylcitrate synthase, partial [Gemmatimonadetes bacterium]|nr:citrate/2-methylcitrate synthase [Gemmatimonadota bacterium]
MRLLGPLQGLAAQEPALGLLGEDPVAPSEDLGYGANYLAMLEGAEAEPERVEALERYLLLTIEHGFNNSAFTARVIASSGADVASAVTGAIGAFSGPLHGGAVDRVPSMLAEIGGVDRVEGYIADAL